MSTLSKEFISETKKEIQRLEAIVRNHEDRIETLQELLRDNSEQEAATKATKPKKAAKPHDDETALVEDKKQDVIANA